MANDYKLTDVDLEAPLRVYTDTPFKLSDTVTYKQSCEPTPGGRDQEGIIGTGTPFGQNTNSNNGTGTTQSVAKKPPRQFFTPDGNKAAADFR